MSEQTVIPFALEGKRGEMVEVFRRYERDRLGFPTVRDLGAEVGLHSPSTVHAHLVQMECGGVIEPVPGTAQRFRDTRYRLVVAYDAPCPRCGKP